MASTKGPLVTISTGALKGKQGQTESGFDFCSFLGIPYAKPPVGELRFKAPQPAEPWVGIRDATKEGNISWQKDLFTGQVSGNEDCLFLNVYTPKLPAYGGKNLPVMVFIHGGGFVMGSGNSDIYGPDYLVQEGVVLVTINYRLNIFGYLNLENENAPGNAGLKDQVAALRWVRDNIKSFGGNPDNVTIFGESAGAVSVHYLLLSESANGLYHKAISQSGSLLSPWAVQQKPLENVFNLCKAMGTETQDIDEAYQFLKSASPKDLIEGQLKIGDEETSTELSLIFIPSIEKEYPGIEPFITELPLKKVTEGKFNQVPYITGFNSEEGLFMLKNIINNKISYDDINLSSKHMVPSCIPRKKKIEAYQKIKKFYFDNEPITEETLIKYARLKGDVNFLHGINKAVLLQSAISKSPVYYYRFAFDEGGLMKMMTGSKLPGACHGDELGLLFKVQLINVPVEKDSNIDKARRRLTKMWTNFAKTGNPTPAIDDLIPVIWEPVKKHKLNYLNIDEEITLSTNPDAERIDFIDKIIGSA